MTDVQNGVFNYILTELHFGDYFQHDWFASPFSQLAMVTSIVVWGALPFVAITIYAALSQVPHELTEAAQIDGARPWQVFKDVTYPDHPARAPDPDEPFDPLGLRGLHAGVPADRPGAHPCPRTT